MIMITAAELPYLGMHIDEIESLVQTNRDVEVRMANGEVFNIVETTLRAFIHVLFEPSQISNTFF